MDSKLTAVVIGISGAVGQSGGLPEALPLRRLSILKMLSLLALTAGAAARPTSAPMATEAPPVPDPAGIWYDNTGDGAVEIMPCGERLCGHIVWLKNNTDKSGRPLTDARNPAPTERQRPICGLQVIGNLEPQASGAWDAGWIYDPKDGRSYDVEIQLRSADRLEVTGYIVTKLVSESFVWTRAPSDLNRCEVR
jgi:uncharacterized protein (DUF2147 family)